MILNEKKRSDSNDLLMNSGEEKEREIQPNKVDLLKTTVTPFPGAIHKKTKPDLSDQNNSNAHIYTHGTHNLQQ